MGSARRLVSKKGKDWLCAIDALLVDANDSRTIPKLFTVHGDATCTMTGGEFCEQVDFEA